jgi:homogentisate 1,2-dioxygenase
MIERRFAGLLPPKPHTALRDEQGKLFYEEMFTRDGFSGAFTAFYHRNPITPSREVSVTDRGFHAPALAEDALRPLKRRLYD